MFTSTKRFLRFIVISFRKNENLRKVHHILLVYAMFHPGTYVCTYVCMSVCAYIVYVQHVRMYVRICTYMYIQSRALETTNVVNIGALIRICIFTPG